MSWNLIQLLNSFCWNAGSTGDELTIRVIFPSMPIPAFERDTDELTVMALMTASSATVTTVTRASR
jgi:hypothetical protein